jgi:hypothetical protein
MSLWTLPTCDLECTLSRACDKQMVMTPGREDRCIYEEAMMDRTNGSDRSL